MIDPGKSFPRNDLPWLTQSLENKSCCGARRHASTVDGCAIHFAPAFRFGMSRFPCRCQQTNGFPCFKVVQDLCPSTVGMVWFLLVSTFYRLKEGIQVDFRHFSRGTSHFHSFQGSFFFLETFKETPDPFLDRTMLERTGNQTLKCYHMWLWVKTVLVPFWGNRLGAPPILVYSGDWDVHWGYWILTHGHVTRNDTLANGTFKTKTCGLPPLEPGTPPI